MLNNAIVRILLLVWIGMVAAVGSAQPVVGPGYVLRTIDGDNEVGSDFAMVDRPGGLTGFFYLADQSRLVAVSCIGQSCSSTYTMSDSIADRGRYVSAAARSALNEIGRAHV